MDTLKIRTAGKPIPQKGWKETKFEPTSHFLYQNGLTGSENTIWEKGDEYAIGEKDTWGNQVGAASVFHKSHVD